MDGSLATSSAIDLLLMSSQKEPVARGTTRTRKRYTPASDDEALRLAELRGFSAAACKLEIDSALIYTWRRVHEIEHSQSEFERQPAAEIARRRA